MATKTAAAKSSKSTALVNVDAEIAKQIAEINEQIGAPSGIKISIKNSQFRLPDGRTSKGPLAFVVLGFVSSNKFYTEKYSEKNPVPPACFAVAQKIADMKPEPTSTDKQSEECGTCPMNQFGSDGNAKACRNFRVLAVLPSDEKDPEAPIYTIEVPPTSIKAWDAYVNALAAEKRIPVTVVTEVTMDEGEYPKLSFRKLEMNKGYKEHFMRQAEALKILTTPPDLQRVANSSSRGNGNRKKTAPARRR